MEEARRNEIAYLMLKRAISKQGVRLDRNYLKREYGAFAKDNGIELEELLEFTEIIVVDLTKDLTAA